MAHSERDKLLLNPTEKYQTAYSLIQAGDYLQAEHCLRALVETYPDHPDVLHLLGIVLKDTDQLEESVTLLSAAVDKCPDNASFQYHYGLALVQAGKIDEAVKAFTIAATINPELHDALYNLAKALKGCGDLEASAGIYRKLLNAEPDHIDGLYNLANLYYELDRTRDAIHLYQRLLSLEPIHQNARTNLALIKSKQGNRIEAIEELEKVLKAKPDHPDANRLYRFLNSQFVPGWHFDMLNDTVRNDAYNQAITRTASKAKNVLEIGTGSGLLALMAARAGAPKVTTCEMVSPLANIAAKIIKKNGYADRVRVINKKSTQLQIGQDLPERADLLICEVFDIGLLGEHFLPALRHAKRNLLSENAIIVPGSAQISALLIECPELRSVNPIKDIAGFDLSDFDVFRPPGYKQIDLYKINHRVLSDQVDVCHIDFRKDNTFKVHQALSVVPTDSGMCHAIVFWFDLFLDSDTMITSRAATRTNHWKQAIQFFDKDYHFDCGQPVNLKVLFNSTGISFRLE